VLQVLDRKWREHLYEMDYLQEGIGLRAMAQRDPLVEYQREGFDMFNTMLDAVKEETVGYLFNVEVDVQEGPAAKEALADDGEIDESEAKEIVAEGLGKPQRPTQLQYTAPTMDSEDGVEHHVGAATATDGDVEKVPRNAPCPCGSGKKFKRCHGDPKNRD
jgi:preprotein translocase subunit SecA